MARTATGAQLTARHRQAQLAIRAGALRDFVRIWPLWRGDERSFQALVEAAIPLVRAHRGASSELAATYFAAFRRAEGVGANATPQLAAPPDPKRVTSSLYVTGSVMTGKAIAAGHSPQAAMQTALTRTSGALTRHVLEGGRETLIRSSAADREARGWTRVTGGTPCAFCAMLAGRGAVYSEDAADFQAHDHCSCAAEPMYEGSELPGDSQRFRELYNRATREASAAGELERGTSNDLLNAFRRAYDAG